MHERGCACVTAQKWKTSFGSQPYPSNVGFRNRTLVIGFAWQVPLPTEQAYQPTNAVSCWNVALALIPEDLWNLDLNTGQDIQDCHE